MLLNTSFNKQCLFPEWDGPREIFDLLERDEQTRSAGLPPDLEHYLQLRAPVLDSRIWRRIRAVFQDQVKLKTKLFLNGASPAAFSFIFNLFQTNINAILQQINVKKCPSSIRRRDSNPRPSEHESTPITSTPGLPPIKTKLSRAVKLKTEFMGCSCGTVGRGFASNATDLGFDSSHRQCFLKINWSNKTKLKKKRSRKGRLPQH